MRFAHRHRRTAPGPSCVSPCYTLTLSLRASHPACHARAATPHTHGRGLHAIPGAAHTPTNALLHRLRSISAPDCHPYRHLRSTQCTHRSRARDKTTRMRTALRCARTPAPAPMLAGRREAPARQRTVVRSGALSSARVPACTPRTYLELMSMIVFGSAPSKAML